MSSSCNWSQTKNLSAYCILSILYFGVVSSNFSGFYSWGIIHALTLIINMPKKWVEAIIKIGDKDGRCGLHI